MPTIARTDPPGWPYLQRLTEAQQLALRWAVARSQPPPQVHELGQVVRKLIVESLTSTTRRP